VLYLGNGSSPAIRDAIAAGELGQMLNPRERTPLVAGGLWAADTGCYGQGYLGDAKWLAWLCGLQEHAARCLFATAPDVVGDAQATVERSAPWLPAIRALGFPAALVAQDGLENLPVPWSTFDYLFIGGTTGWKLSAAARDLAAEATARGLPCHMGRVNSYRRLRYAHAIGCTTTDGTYLTFGPEKNLARLRTWVLHPTLF
jgi:hypothetical protein